MRFRYSIHRVQLIKNQLQAVYYNLVIQSFAISLIAIFVPIYLLKLGYSLDQVILFVALKFAALSFFSPVSAVLARRLGFKKLILIRIPMYMTYLILLFALEKYMIPIYLIGPVGGISGSLYWVSIKSIFAKHSHKENRGRETSKMASLTKLATIFGPAIGGVIAVTLGFRALLFIVTIIFFLSALPLISCEELKPKRHSLKNVFSRENKDMLFCFIANGARGMANGILWPLFVYLTLNSVQSVGYMATTASIGTAFFMLSVGKATDRLDRRKMMKFGGLLVGIIFAARYFAAGWIAIFMLTFFAEMCSGILDIPFNTIFYDRANDSNPIDFMVLAEIGLGIGRIGFLLLLLMITHKFLIGFLLAALAAIYYFAKY